MPRILIFSDVHLFGHPEGHGQVKIRQKDMGKHQELSQKKAKPKK